MKFQKMTEISQRVLGSATDEHLGSIEIEETTISSKGLRAKVLNYGGILNALEIRKDDGKFLQNFSKTGQFILEWVDVITGWDTAQGVVDNRRFSGRLIGRYANRIANGEVKFAN